MLDSTDSNDAEAIARNEEIRSKLALLRSRLAPDHPEPQHKRPKLRLIQGGKAGLLAPWLTLVDHVKEHAVATVTVAATVPLLLVGPTMSLPESPDPLLTDIGAPAYSSPDAGTTRPLAPRGDSGRVSATRPRPIPMAVAPPVAAGGSGSAGAALMSGPLASEIPLTTPAATVILPVLEPLPEPEPAPAPQPVPIPVDEPEPAPEPAPEPTTPPAPEPEALPVQERVASCVEAAKGGTMPECAGLVPQR